MPCLSFHPPAVPAAAHPRLGPAGLAAYRGGGDVDQGGVVTVGDAAVEEFLEFFGAACLVGGYAVAGRGSGDVEAGNVESWHARGVLQVAEFLEDAVFGVGSDDHGDGDLVGGGCPQCRYGVMNGAVPHERHDRPFRCGELSPY